MSYPRNRAFNLSMFSELASEDAEGPRLESCALLLFHSQESIKKPGWEAPSPVDTARVAIVEKEPKETTRSAVTIKRFFFLRCAVVRRVVRIPGSMLRRGLFKGNNF